MTGDAGDGGDVEGLIGRRRAADPRRSPGREPVGAATTRRLLAVTAAVVAVATFVLVLMLVLG